MSEKRVYLFGNGKAEGNAKMREELGGKGANLAEMNLIGVPVPPGFTITTDCCNEYYEVGQEKIMQILNDDVTAAVKHIEVLMNSKFGDKENPLLVSVRSGARASMPGMMDTILNLGLNDEVAEGMVKKTNNPHFVYDSYRRFVQMYGDVVLEMKPVNKEDIDPFEEIIEKVKERRGVKLDKDLSVEELQDLVKLFKAAIKERTGKDFPDDPIEQLWGAICAVFRSWMNERAILYRKMEGIPDEWGTAVSVMAMVFGNMGDTSATGVCFSRDAGNGENLFNGEYLVNAQGEDVVAGIRTPQQITKIGSQRWAERAGISEEERAAKYPSMEEAMPEIYAQLNSIQEKLENHDEDDENAQAEIERAKKDGDSVGGTISCEVTGLPPGLGGALSDGLEGGISSAVFAIPGAKGVFFGDGCTAEQMCQMRGSEYNDAFAVVKNGLVGSSGSFSWPVPHHLSE